MSAIILHPLNPIPTISSLPQLIISSKPPKISLKPKTPYFFNSKKPIFTPKIQTLPIKNPSLTDFDDAHVTNFTDLLRLSVQENDIYLAKAVHASLVKLGHEGDTRLWNALLVACLKLGFNDYAYKVFDCMSCPDVVSFSSLVSGFAKSGWEDEAVQLFVDMISLGVEANEYSYVGILSACIQLGSLSLGSQVHGLVVKLGYLDSVYVTNALLGLYGKCGCLDSVLSLFSEVPRRDIATWNTVLSSVVKESIYEKSFELFRCMWQIDGFRVDHFTLSTLLVACSGSLASMNGREIHAHALKSGLLTRLSVGNALIRFYSKCRNVSSVVSLFESMHLKDIITWTEMMMAYMAFGLVDKAVETFNRMPEKNSVSCNAVLGGLCQNGRGIMALNMFSKMVEKGVELTDFTLASVVNACGLLREKRTSEMIQGFVIKFGSGSNDYIESAMVDMSTRCGRMSDAEKMFRSRPLNQSSPLIWTSMICGYARNGQPYESASLYCLGYSEGTMAVDEVLSASVLGVCGTLGSSVFGGQVHCHAIKSGFLSDTVVENAIMSMYFKCGNIKEATAVFKAMPTPDIVSWNGLMAGYILHRQGDLTLTAWEEMQQAGLPPDSTTFLILLSAYKYTISDLVYDCRKLFVSMNAVYGVEPASEHYATFVSVLGFWGHLEEAEEVIIRMPIQPEPSVWRALLDSCRIHMNTDIGKRAAKQILLSEPQDPSTYILVSNLFSASGRWHCSEMIKEKMREKGFRKLPVRSWIFHQNRAHFFFARDKSHFQSKDINKGLEILVMECLKAGYVPDTSFVLHEVEEYQKKDFLFYHSAKLAVTYGLLMTEPGKIIRVMKNVILCGDCHTFFKYVSVITKREIHVRDSSGFHCFWNGQCSCKDYR
ncbi:hypothetical protein DCAR_0624289 [Daucus carota subsp. sativus]|uniref:Uncharacterized protein n=1 Tax=Daucus carota subsp. sativus TaxID=79200 RepID=A0A164VRC0_DAUCS|nr:PREDICTED: pentatricopeptide repeat-containing protein At5g03800 [Daucus carota subsp. sativus]WOH04877.1 hypothetical protein DCAR_0624289 [Daucus carota subsp. sativus]